MFGWNAVFFLDFALDLVDELCRGNFQGYGTPVNCSDEDLDVVVATVHVFRGPSALSQSGYRRMYATFAPASSFLHQSYRVEDGDEWTDGW